MKPIYLSISFIFTSQELDLYVYNNSKSINYITRKDGCKYYYLTNRFIQNCLKDNYDLHNQMVDLNRLDYFDIADYIDLIPNNNKAFLSDLFCSDDYDDSNCNVEPVSISNAVSLIPFNEFQTMKQPGRLNLWSCTIIVDLSLIGRNRSEEISNDVKVKEATNLLNSLEEFYIWFNDIRMSLYPIFAIGGLFEDNIPYFIDALSCRCGKLDIEKIKSAINEMGSDYHKLKVGLYPFSFRNEEQLHKEFDIMGINEFIDAIIEELPACYDTLD